MASAIQLNVVGLLPRAGGEAWLHAALGLATRLVINVVAPIGKSLEQHERGSPTMAAKETKPALAALSRLYWMMIGPMVLALAGASIVNKGNGWFTVADVGFLAALALMALARWLEFQGGSPMTSEGQPATPAHLRRYLITLTAVGLALWIGANVLGNYVFTRS